MAKLTSFQNDVRPLFTEGDIHAMSKAFNLGSYDRRKSARCHHLPPHSGDRWYRHAFPADERRRALASISD
jgi:hypothetical protein